MPMDFVTRLQYKRKHVPTLLSFDLFFFAARSRVWRMLLMLSVLTAFVPEYIMYL
jgi:hypothetical protein